MILQKIREWFCWHDWVRETFYNIDGFHLSIAYGKKKCTKCGKRK